MLKVALVGKPNVGKSSLFNLLAKKRVAITSDIAGTTRDYKRAVVEFQNPNSEDDKRDIELIDTGGLEERDELFKSIRENSISVAKDADIVLFLVDGKSIPDEEDKKIFRELSKESLNIALVINKVDNEREQERAWEFSEFGVDELFPISVSHNRNTIKLKEWIYSIILAKESLDKLNQPQDDFDSFLENFDENGELIQKSQEAEIEGIRVAIIGRPNVGKSSLLNALLNENRVVVSPIAGTTVDPIDEAIEYRDREITFVDTAGIRRRGKIEGIEKYALNRTQSMLSGATIAVLVLDSSESFKDLDEKIAGVAKKFQLGVIVVFNKWDIAYDSYKNITEEFKFKFKFLEFAPIMTLSSLTKRNIDKLKDKILEVDANNSQRISTSKLNEVIKEAQKRHPIPSDRGRVVKIYFATQFQVNPPKIALISNRPNSIHFSYKRYLKNFLRDNFNFEGVQLELIAKKRGEREESEEES